MQAHTSYKPFKPSHLSIPDSPCSPLSPLSPLSRSAIPRKISPLQTPPSSDPPPQPLTWIWRCHKCHQVYALNVTRRCLEDGHECCAARSKAKIRRYNDRSFCRSEFDYKAWKRWGSWKREQRSDDNHTRNCWESCNYPSECWWGCEYGIHTS